MLLGVMDERNRRRERENMRQPRSCWQRDWIARRRDFGRYNSPYGTWVHVLNKKLTKEYHL